MKKILTFIICLFAYFVCEAQFPITQNLGGPTTLVKNPNYGGLQGGLIPYTFTDTSSANSLAPYLKQYNGALIYCTTPNALFWRDATHQIWIQVLPSGGGGTGGLGAWTTTLNTAIPTDISLNGYFGTTSSNGIGIYTSNTQRLIMPATGLSLLSSVSDTTANKVMTFNPSTKIWGYSNWYGGGSGSTPTWQQTLTAGSTLSSSNTIVSGANTQTFTFNTLNGTGFSISSSSTSGVAIPQKLLSSVYTGAHASGGVSSYAGFFSNQHTGSTSLNVGVWAQAFGGTTNVGLLVDRGSIDIGLIGTETGILNMYGVTSGKITFQPQAAAGTYNWNWPTTAGTSGYFLTSAGGGSSAMTWTQNNFLTGITVGTTAIASGTAGRILFEGSGNVLQESSNLFWDNSNTRLGIGTSSPQYPVHLLINQNAATRFVVENQSSGSSAYASFDLARSFGADYYATFAYANESSGIFTPLSLNITTASGSTGGIFTTTVGAAPLVFSTTNTERMRILSGGNVGIGDATPASLFTVGSGDLFQVNTSGDLIKLKNVTYSWPSSNSSGVLLNNGSGALSWTATSSLTGLPYWPLSGSAGLTSSVTVDLSSYDFTITNGGAGSNMLLTSSPGQVFITLDGANKKLFLYSQAIGGSSAGDALTVADPLTGELTVAPNLAFNLKKEGTMIYANNGRIFAEDNSGNKTQISPHNEKGEWIYKSTDKSGITTEINMIHLAELLEKVTGEKLIYKTKN